VALTLPAATIDDVAHVIQLAIAPVFLLTGVSSLLGVLTSRLGRIIDRGRRLEERLHHAKEGELDSLHEQFARLTRRAYLMNWSISLATGSALLICSVIVALFAGATFGVDVGYVAAGLFVIAMFALIGALLCFLREVYLATVQFRLGPDSS